jgi:hypothetical protein
MLIRIVSDDRALNKSFLFWYQTLSTLEWQHRIHTMILNISIFLKIQPHSHDAQ